VKPPKLNRSLDRYSAKSHTGDEQLSNFQARAFIGIGKRVHKVFAASSLFLSGKFHANLLFTVA